MPGGEPLDVGRLVHLGELRHGQAEPGQPAAHHQLVLGVQQRVRGGVHGDARVDERAQVLLRHLLVVERDGRAAAGERAQRGQVGGRAGVHVGADQRGRVGRVGGEHPQRLAEGDRGLVGHPGELPGADHPDDREGARTRTAVHG